MLEDDGRVDEQIFNEYMSLSLRYPPRFRQVTTEASALNELAKNRFELVIFMPNMVDEDIFGTPKKIKSAYPTIPIVVLTPFSKEVSKSIANEDLSAIDYVFSWLGEAELLLAIIKIVEDSLNAPFDTRNAGVQVILLVEDSIRFYSAELPHLYKIVLKQSREFAKEALNEHHRTLRMRGRPKILLAKNYEEAMAMYDNYKDYLLGVVSDFSFLRGGVKDPLAGYNFCKHICEQAPTTPLILESSEASNAKYADELGAAFIDKNAKTYPLDLQRNVMERFGFGDFVITLPEGDEIRITNLKDLQNKINSIPDNLLKYHLGQNHFSRFLYSRALFPPAKLLKQVDVSEYNGDMQSAKDFITDVIVQYRKMKNTGVVAEFEKDRFDTFSNFARIGQGSLGGKGRGLAFIGALLKRNPDIRHPEMPVTIPKTVVLCTDIFDRFMEHNDLYKTALSDISDDDMLQAFLIGELPDSLVNDVRAFIEVVKSPLAVRSSSLLEDSHYQPFAGVYSTYMAPYCEHNIDLTLQAVLSAIKGVYASVYYRESKNYMVATSNLIESEKMAIVLQEVAGRHYGGDDYDRYYPALSGVAKSLNFYPVGREKIEDGIANIALGLGKYVVDGMGATIRFSPRYPKHIIQLSTVKAALHDTQKNFVALNMRCKPEIEANDAYNLVTLQLNDADKDGALRHLVSTYDITDNSVRDGYYAEGKKILSFAGILKNDKLPLAATLRRLLDVGCNEMGRPVEIEFAVDIKDSDTATFYMLQIRPIADLKEVIDEDLSTCDRSDALLYSEQALGHGLSNDVSHVLYVKSADFDATANRALAAEIEKINARGFAYILVGPGRWGSADSFLGIPVKWSQISNARLIAEYSLAGYAVEPSQGTHFFQNLTSNNTGYFTINPSYRGFFDEQRLNDMPAVSESQHLRLVCFERPLTIKIDGRKGVGIVNKC
jgi:DNA-binding response OmpR family regulator